MDSTSAKFVGSSCGQHGPYTFYKAFKYFKDKKPKILSLGEFFFVEIVRDAPVSIGELQLLWHDKNSNQLLTSVRLYFLPDHTPDGKLDYHGEHEILALSEKLILRLDDLVTLIAEDVPWSDGLKAFCEDDGQTDLTHNDELVQAFRSNNCGLQFNDVKKEKELIGDVGVPDSVQQVVIMSYPQYCRYRTVLKRLENMMDKWLRNAIVSAIGGFSVRSRNCRIMFCRETFYHPELEDFELRCDHLAPNLKGRPRKKKTLKRECSQDSDSYEDGSDTSSLASTSQAPSSTSSRPRRRSSQNGLGWEKGGSKVTKEEQNFMISLHKFMRNRQTPIDRVPSLGFKQIDLYYFYSYAKKLGGYDMITEKRLWKHLYDKLGGHPGSTSAATCTRRHYERLLLAFERYEKGDEPRNKIKSKVKAMINNQNRGHDKAKLKPELEEKKELLMQAIDVSMEEKVRKWNEIRRQKAMERDQVNSQLKRGHPRQTVKKMLDKVSFKENKVEDLTMETLKEVKVQIPKMTSIENGKVKIEPVQISSIQKTDLEVPSVKQRTRPSILSPLVQRKVQNHVKSLPTQSQQQTPLPPLQTSAHLQQMPHTQPPQTPVITTHALFYASNFPLPASHFIAHTSSSPSVEVAANASENSNMYFPKSSLFVTNNASQINENESKKAIPSMRPSVIQHTPKPKLDEVKYEGTSNSRTHSPSTYSSKPIVPAHSGPAHSHQQLKRPYPYPNVPQTSHLPSRDHSRPHLSPVLANDPYFNSVKRVRADPPASRLTPAHMNHSKSSDMSSNEDQPVDFSMKTMREKEQKRVEQKRDFYEKKDLAPKTFKCALFPQEFPTSRASLKDHERPGSRSDIRSASVRSSSPLSLVRSQERHSASPTSTGSRSATSTPLNNNKALSKPLTASAAYSEVPSPHLHPAFPAPYMPSHISPNSVVTSPAQLQQMYAAQYANIQMAAYEDMMRQQVLAQVGNTSPILISPTQLYQNIYKDTQKFSASKS
ncbi:AT-rich interactive domain-containing protein 5B-like isoform X1 [Haliotis rufescens]|uniref:AT-rich interactive domain-containing protein 5B-like isoform X1 n=1 Tax=Haliotis rufescens TaxID=6454 RepID=UPI00201FA602|nr:AT-rich interactive domain-containing protein 5B-like isoform X1 [Haliotis rufescens]